MALDAVRAAADPVLTARGLCVSFGAAKILRDISLDLNNGERVALIGPNGAGKSTLLRALVGLVPSTGRIDAFGRPCEIRTLRQEVGFVFQHHALVRRLTALSNVVHGLMHRPGGWRAWHQAVAPAAFREAAMEALALVDLTEKAPVRVDNLSGGQAQRVAIARALVRGPRLLIADEPAASLDPAAGHDVMARLADTSGNRTLLFTSHDLDHARTYATRIVALVAGRVVFDRPASQLDLSDLRGLFPDRAA
ncbi:phosphonate ABC transporter ATP-binding protein [Aestuariibius sp. 2305UL40-4]|uniref:phosphonate ABC transporter ATP-binding protein n=1 Tax=Aestuariibius violaceus TaxID=3234132 RepID=UPI00345EAAE2